MMVEYVAAEISKALGEPFEEAKKGQREYLLFVARTAIEALRAWEETHK